MQTQDEKIINTQCSMSPKAAAIDVLRRSADAEEQFASFFNDPAHVKKVEEVKTIVSKFFTVYSDMYVNCRANRGRPMTVVKIERPLFPKVSTADKNKRYLGPLQDLGVEIVFSKNSNSYLYRIR